MAIAADNGSLLYSATKYGFEGTLLSLHDIPLIEIGIFEKLKPRLSLPTIWPSFFFI